MRLSYPFLCFFFFWQGYLYTGVIFHKSILNKVVGAWKSDLLGSLRRELYIYKYFYKRCFRKHSRGLTVIFVIYSQFSYLVAFYVKLPGMQKYVVSFKLHYYYKEWNCLHLFRMARTFWNIVFHRQVNFTKYNLLHDGQTSLQQRP